MKKLIALILSLVLVLTLVACGAKSTGDAKTVEGTMEELANKIVEQNPVEFMGGVIPVDLTDTSEDGLWALTWNTGLTSGEKLTDIAVYEPMIGSMAFSMVLVRVADANDAKSVAQEMSDNIDTRKWVCVEANEKLVVGYGDVVMLIMLDSQLGLTAQSFVDAFASVCGGELDFTI